MRATASGEGSQRGSKGYHRARLRLVVAGTLAAALLAAAVLPGSAQAGIYKVRECYPAAGFPGSPDAVFSTNGSAAISGRKECTSGGDGMVVKAQGTFPGAFDGHWSFRAPTGLLIQTVAFRRLSYWDGGYSSAVYLCPRGGGAACIGWSDVTSGFVFTQTPTGRWKELSSWVLCPAGTTCGGFGAGAYLANLEFTILDDARPKVTELGGSLLAGGVRHGTETLAISASDTGSGVRGTRVRVNGTEIAHLRTGCGRAGVQARFRPCGNPTYEPIAVNTESAPWSGGRNYVEVCSYDLSTTGAPNEGCAGRTVTVDNSCPGSGGAPATAISAGVAKPGAAPRPAIVVGSHKGASISGTLASASGPVGGATVCLYERVGLAGATTQLTGFARTKPNGGFALGLPPGPSRSLRLAYRHNNRLLYSQELLLDSVVKPSLKVRPKRLRNGRKVKFKGRIPGPNAGGRAVVMQAKAGKKWRTFKQVRTNAKGAFKAIYRFTQTRGTARYSFRARVKGQAGYPYRAGSSKVRKVLVRG